MNATLSVLWYLFIGIQIFLASFLLQPVIQLVVYLIKKAIGKKTPENKVTITRNYKFGVIVTAHRETTFIPPIVDSLLKQTYPHFRVYVVADDCDISDLHFDDPRVSILKPPVAFNTNSKSIQYAIDHFREDDEVMVLFDPDNLVHPRFLETFNSYYNKGYKAVQGNLYSKNIDGTYEKMDSVGIIFNNFVDRDFRSEFGLSVNMWGCGISVDRKVYEKIAYDNKSTMGGFDKHMQAEIARNIPCLAYAKDAILYDEKVSDSGNLEKQRVRWIAAYFKFLNEAFQVFFEGIRKGNFNLTYFGYNLIRPPYFLQILFAIFFTALNLFISIPLALGWIGVIGLFLTAFVTIVTIRAPYKSIRQGLLYMPLFFVHQNKSLLKLNMNKKSILKTDHTKVLYIDDLLKNEAC